MSEWIKKLTEKYSEVNENQKAAMAKKLAKASASSEKGKAAVTLPKAPFEIPESIPANERTAFHGAAAAAHKAGQSHFSFQGKKYPVTMKKDTAKAIADDVQEGKVDEISVGKLQNWAKAAAKDLEKNRAIVRTALEPGASQKKAEKGMKAMKAIGKRSRGSDMYTDKMTGRSKVKPTAESDEVVMNPKKDKKEKANDTTMAQESYSAMNEGSYDRAAYGKGDAYERSEAHEEAARDHEMAAEKHEKARNFTKADLHTAAAKAHQKAADNFSRIHAKRQKGRAGGILNTTKSRDAHAASMKANSYNESTEWPVYARILENRAAHYKGATPPQENDDGMSPNAKKMKRDQMAGKDVDDTEEKGHDDAEKAARITKAAPARNGDRKEGDKAIINKPEDVTQKGGMKG